MAQVLGGNQVKLNDGSVVSAQQGGWYDGRQFWGGTLSNPGEINALSNQVGAGQQVSEEVNRQTSVAAGLAPDANQRFIEEQRRQQQQQQQQQQQAPQAQAPADGGQGFSQADLSGMAGITAEPQINLPELYAQLNETSGVRELEDELSQKTEDYITAKGDVNDNPFLSEASRSGRVAKLDQLFQERTANLRNDIQTRKADVETQLNLQMQQFDINSQAVDRAWQQFNSLLDMGALDNANGGTIAEITRATGISSDMIRGAIQARNTPQVSPQVIKSEDDNGVVTVSVIDANTGNLISQTSLGAVGTVTKQAKGSVEKEEEKDPVRAAASEIQEYILTKEIQQRLSPEDFVRSLKLTYPEASEYIETEWSAVQIREQTGQ
jgi:ribosome biogenesis protein Nip4